MIHRFEHVGRAYELGTSGMPGKARARLDPDVARRVLAAAMGDAARMRQLRSLLAVEWVGGGVSRMSDVEVVEHLAARIASRRLHVYEEPSSRRAYQGRQPAEIEEALAPLSVREAEQPAEAERIDAQAQAVALRRAARDGAPFCEECEKARREREAPAPASPSAPEPFAETDAVAQASAMREASAAGLPFCEECARAREARTAADTRGA